MVRNIDRYNQMFDLDVHHYMTVTKGGFVISEIHL